MSFISPIPTNADGSARLTGAQQSLGKDDFLQLMITKLQHQDPMKPMEDEDFIAQLAQFSSLEQMSNIATGIDASNQWDYLQMQSMNNVMAAGFIGKDVEADLSGFYLNDSNQPSISYNTSRYADEVKFEIVDESGHVVRTLTAEGIDAGQNRMQWDGRDDIGNRAAEGYYTIRATATDPSGSTFDPKLSLAGTVSSVVYREGQAFLLVNGTEIALGDVKTVGQPGSLTDDD